MATLWKIDTNADSIREVDEEKARKNQMIGEYYRRYELFDSEREAVDFLVERAIKLEGEAVKALDKAEKRLAKCRKIQRERFKI